MEKIFGINDPFLIPIVDKINKIIDALDDDTSIETFYENSLDFTILLSAVPKLVSIGIEIERSEYDSLYPTVLEIAKIIKARHVSYSPMEWSVLYENEAKRQLMEVGMTEQEIESKVNDIVLNGRYIKRPPVYNKTVRGAWSSIDSM